METHSLSPLQKRLLEMLRWFHEFCVEHDVTYYVAGGTLLGAVRHKGFIPWDDDVDIVLPRPDYERLIQLARREDCGRYLVETPDSENPDFYYAHAKLFDTETTLVEKAKYEIKRGVFLDLFPLDGAGSSYAEAKRTWGKVAKWNNLRTARVGVVRPQRSAFKNLVIEIAQLIPGALLDDRALAQKISHMWEDGSYENSTYVSVFVGSYGKKEIWPKYIYGQPQIMEFEDLSVYGVEQPELYLEAFYGDWRVLPPTDQREGVRHDYLELDLNRSYLNKTN